MKTLKFKCTLLTDVILNQKSTSEGANQTLDFIPGNVFLGIAAGKLYAGLESSEARRLFHSSEVRFGDAHPAIGNNRTLHVPASLYSPKLQRGSVYYVHHRIPDSSAEALRKMQLKQERKGYIDFSQREEAVKVSVLTNFAIKSAYDRVQRKSKDEQLYGFQSMAKGLSFYFKVEIDDTLDGTYADQIRAALEGVKCIGHSRSSQYGQAEIISCDYNEQPTFPSGTTDELVIYADSRIILLDGDGYPTVEMDKESFLSQLGLMPSEGNICWDKCQVGLFKYTPYNHKRRSFDSERYGFEKGSVWVVKLAKPVAYNQLNGWIGAYRNEGFGRVLYNPAFLEADKEGKTAYAIVEDKEMSQHSSINGLVFKQTPDSMLLGYLERCRQDSLEMSLVYEEVNRWVEQYKFLFRGKTFAAQWGNIRRIAEYGEEAELQRLLFDEKTGYLRHGVAKEKWEDKYRFLQVFLKEKKRPALALVNLCDVMQKLASSSE